MILIGKKLIKIVLRRPGRGKENKEIDEETEKLSEITAVITLSYIHKKRSKTGKHPG